MAKIDLGKANKSKIRDEVYRIHKELLDEERRALFEVKKFRTIDSRVRHLEAKFEDALHQTPANRAMILRGIEKEVEAIEVAIKRLAGQDRIKLVESKAAFRDLEAIKNNISHMLPYVKKFIPAIR